MFVLANDNDAEEEVYTHATVHRSLLNFRKETVYAYSLILLQTPCEQIVTEHPSYICLV